MAEIHKKITSEYFDLIQSGKKKFEFRLADFNIQEGDSLVLEEGVEERGRRKPTGCVIEKRVDYIAKFKFDEFNSKEDVEKYGFFVIQFE